MLRPLFVPKAVGFGLPDLDAAALRLARPRAITQGISSWGRNELLATFERGTDHETVETTRLDDNYLHAGGREVARAMTFHGLTWAPVHE